MRDHLPTAIGLLLPATSSSTLSSGRHSRHPVNDPPTSSFAITV